MSNYDRHIAELRKKGSNFAGPELTDRPLFPVLQAPGDVREVHAKHGLPDYVPSFNPDWQFVLAHGFDRQALMVMVRKDWWPERRDWEDDKPWAVPEGPLAFYDLTNRKALDEACDTALLVRGATVVSDKSPWITPDKPMPVYELIPTLDSKPLASGSGKSAGTIRYVAAKTADQDENSDGPCVLFVEAVPVGDPSKLTPANLVFKVDTFSRQLPGSMLNSDSIELAFRFMGRRGYKVLDLGHRG